jgi:hypothetical protein
VPKQFTYLEDTQEVFYSVSKRHGKENKDTLKEEFDPLLFEDLEAGRTIE